MKRRNFVKTLASLAAVGSVTGVASAASLSVVSRGGSGFQGPAAPVRSFTGGSYTLKLNGLDLGILSSVEGGHPVSDVVTEGADKGFATKRLGTLRYEPLRLTLPVPVHPELGKLIADLGAVTVFKTLVLVGYDLDGKASSSREANDAVLTEIGFEQLDATVKEPLRLVLVFHVAGMRTVEGSGGTAAIGAKQKAALTSNFSFSIAGVESKRIVSVKPIIAKRTVPAAIGGDARAPVSAPTRFEVQPIELTVSMADAAMFVKWFEEFAIKRSQTAEKTAKLEILGADLKAVLYTASLSGVGISALRMSDYASGSEKLNHLTATLYAERLTFGS